jgi:hypothetical protein
MDSRLRGEAPLALDKRARGNDGLAHGDPYDDARRKHPGDSFIIAFWVHDHKIYESQLWR